MFVGTERCYQLHFRWDKAEGRGKGLSSPAHKYKMLVWRGGGGWEEVRVLDALTLPMACLVTVPVPGQAKEK